VDGRSFYLCLQEFCLVTASKFRSRVSLAYSLVAGETVCCCPGE